MLSRLSCASLALLLAAACADEKGPEEDLPTEEGKLDSFSRPSYQGDLPFSVSDTGILTADERHLVWTFQLSGPASIHTFTSRVPHYASIDTVLYLYKLGPTGWGPYIARNDDDGRNGWSSLDRDLDAGDYRILVKGHAAATRGRFQVQLDCTGAGCEPPPSCVFGSAYYEIGEQPHLVVTNRAKLRSPAGLSPLRITQIIDAVHQSSHTDVSTIEEAFAAVDQSEFNVVSIYEPLAARTFTAIEYGAGDNSYGAIFAGETSTMVTNIHDGDLENCTVVPSVCLLGSSYNDLRNSPAFTRSDERIVTTASELSGLAAQQALAAIRVAYTDATDLANGLTLIDAGGLHLATYTHTATGLTLSAFDYGAGDNAYGAVYNAGTLTPAATINDLDFYNCSVFE